MINQPNFKIYMKAFEKYKSAAVATSDTSHQLIFIFDELTKLLHTAQKALGESDHEVKFKALARAIEVFYILKSGIDVENADESTKTLDTFYGATIAQLENLNMSAEKPEELQGMIDAIVEVRSALVTANENRSNDASGGEA